MYYNEEFYNVLQGLFALSNLGVHPKELDMAEEIEKKICSKCKDEKDITQFYFNKKEDRYYSRCKLCLRELNRQQYHKIYRKKHIAKRQETSPKYNEENNNSYTIITKPFAVPHTFNKPFTFPNQETENDVNTIMTLMGWKFSVKLNKWIKPGVVDKNGEWEFENDIKNKATARRNSALKHIESLNKIHDKIWYLQQNGFTENEIKDKLNVTTHMIRFTEKHYVKVEENELKGLTDKEITIYLYSKRKMKPRQIQEFVKYKENKVYNIIFKFKNDN